MCNLYNLTTTQQAILDWTRALRDLSGNLEPSIDVYPDTFGPIVRNGQDSERELVRVRWGLPSSQFALMQATKKRAAKLEEKTGEKIDFAELLRMEPDRGTTNIRNVDSKHWKRWLGKENRCVVPLTSFAEPHKITKKNHWFALDESKALAFFAGIWVPMWTSVRKIKEGPVTIDLYGFLTTEPNAVVEPIHEKAMPVILTTREEVDLWLSAPWDEVKHLQRPLPQENRIIVETPAKPEATGLLL